MRLIRVAIWLATAFFVVMLFMPLVRQMVMRLATTGQSGMP
jgi:preprotein translocase subunit SecG